MFWLFALNLKDIAYNGDFHETLDRVHVKYVLSKGTFMSETVATFVQKVGLSWLQGGFFLIIQDINVIVGLKRLITGTNVTTLSCAQGRN